MLELNPVSHGVVSPYAQRKTGDAVGEHRLEKSLNTKEDNQTESAKAASKAEDSAAAKRHLPSHLGKHIDTVA